MALDLYAFLWSEFCDWYLEMVKPRLYEGDEAARATVLYVLDETLALLHPLMPFVTEEIHGFVPGREGLLAVARLPGRRGELAGRGAEREVEAVTRRSSACAATARTSARRRPRASRPARDREPDTGRSYERSLDTIARLARFDLEIVGARRPARRGDGRDPRRDRRRAGGRGGGPRAPHGAGRASSRQEIERSEGKLANPGFVEKAPPELVQQERDKLERYRRELDDLERKA